MKVQPVKTCAEEGCEGVVFCRGMCAHHYRKWWASARRKVKRPSLDIKVERRFENG